MITKIDIQNFKCFKHLTVDSCGRVNVIVGDNGSGKTALLEAIFWALGTTSELAIRYRQQRGLDGAFNSTPRRIEEAIWRDYFFNGDWTKTVSIDLTGDGPEARSVKIFRGSSQMSLPLTGVANQNEEISGAITVVWRDSVGLDHKAQSKIGRTIDFEGTSEDLSGFFYFPSNGSIGSVENAGRFSELSRAQNAEEFVKIFTTEYNWIDNLAIEVIAGAPVVYATLKDGNIKIPLPNISGGINRVIGVLLGIASQPKSIVLVDEMENGVYYKHHDALWRSLLMFTRSYKSQLFVTTHSEEWLRALINAAGNDIDDIVLWRIERADKGQPEVLYFDGDTLKSGIEYGAEVRGGTE